MLSAKTNDAAKLTPDEADLETVGPGEAVQGINISELSLGDEFTIGQHMNTAVALDSKEGYQALVKHVEGVLLSDAPKEVKSKIKKELNTAVAVIVKEAKDIQDRRAWLEEETQKVNERDKHNLPLFMRGTAILGESTPAQSACLLRQPPLGLPA